LADPFQVLAPWCEALLRAAVGLALVPHGLLASYSCVPGTGLKRSIRSAILPEKRRGTDLHGRACNVDRGCRHGRRSQYPALRAPGDVAARPVDPIRDNECRCGAKVASIDSSRFRL
jgi:hypothetical protein